MKGAPTRRRHSSLALAATVAVALGAVALLPGAAKAASVRVEELGGGEPPTLLFEAEPAEANQVALTVAGQESDKVRYSLRDLGADLSTGPGCSGGGAPGSEVSCLVPRSRPQLTCGDGHYICDPGRGVTLSFALADESDSLDTTSVDSDGGGGSLSVAVESGDGADAVASAATADEIDPGPGGDSVRSGPGDDHVDGGASPDGADLIDLGAGWDTVSYLAARAPVTAALNGIADDGAAGEQDNVLAAETVLGTRAADTLIGSDNPEPAEAYGYPFTETLLGCGGGDVLIGNGGNDSLRHYGPPCDGPASVSEEVVIASLSEGVVIEGGSGDDEIWADRGADVADGGPGEDSFYMGGGDDRASGGSGGDRIDGGDDADRLRGGRGPDRIYPGHFESWSNILDDAKDRIDCGESLRDQAIGVEGHDRTRRCEEVQLRPNGWPATSDLKLKGQVTAAKSQRQTGNRIVVRVKVKAKEALIAKATGKVSPAYKLRPKKVRLAAGETKTLKPKPKQKAAATTIAGELKRGEKATARVKVKLTDLAGNSESERLRVRLKR